MKTSTNIFFSALLSIMIVWTGIGVVLMQCAHTGSVSVMNPMQMEAGDGCGTMKDKGCMKTQLLKLSPTSQAHSAVEDVQPMQISLLASMLTNICLLPLPFVAKVSARGNERPWCSPPRAELRKLTVLLI